MPSIYGLKSSFQNLLRPLTRLLARMGVTANQVTLFALALSFATGGLIWAFPDEAWPLFLVAPVLFARMALNAIDGMLAREHHMKSKLGAILNELGDVLSDAALYLPYATRPGVSPHLLVLAVLLSVISEMAGVVAIQIGSDRRYDGPMGKSDRAFVFGVLALLLGFKAPTEAWLLYALAAVNIFLLLTIFNRARMALRKAG